VDPIFPQTRIVVTENARVQPGQPSVDTCARPGKSTGSGN